MANLRINCRSWITHCSDAHFRLATASTHGSDATGYWAGSISSLTSWDICRPPGLAQATDGRRNTQFLGILLEVLQCLDPIHSPNPLAALSSVTGVLVRTSHRNLSLIPQEREAVAAIDRASARQH